MSDVELKFMGNVHKTHSYVRARVLFTFHGVHNVIFLKIKWNSDFKVELTIFIKKCLQPQ
jgi:hypothetical protein